MSFNYAENLKSLNMPILSDEKIAQIIGYVDFLKEENQKKNLISRKASDEDIFKFIKSSLVFVKYIENREAKKIVDIGSGSGFPAIICAICFPEIEFSVMDSVQKKIDFLYDVTSFLKLKNIECFWGRIEDFGDAGGLREEFDFCTAMALGTIELTTNYAMPFLKKGGEFLTIKSLNQENEFSKAEIFLEKIRLEMKISKEILAESFMVIIKKC